MMGGYRIRYSRPVLVVALLVMAMMLAACSGDTRVGDDALLDFEEQEGGRLGLEVPGETPATEAPPDIAPPPPQQEPQAQPTQAPPPPEDTGPQIALDITINSDTSGTSQFDPSAARIFQGTCARFTNTDSVARSVEADNGSFSSGPIAPGGNWVYCGEVPGTYNYHDGTRPYAVAFLEVVAR